MKKVEIQGPEELTVVVRHTKMPQNCNYQKT